MTILVTGATGFLGSNLCRALSEAGERVRAFHRPTSSLALLAGLRVETVAGDLTQPESLLPAFQGVRTVFHVAAEMGRAHSARAMYAGTVTGTRNVLAVAAIAGVRRVVHTSSVAALGVPVNVETARHSLHTLPDWDAWVMDEHHTWNYPSAWWRYGHAKYLAELEVQRAVAKGLEVVTVNPSVVLGPGDRYQVSGRVVLQVARNRLPVSVAGGLNVVHIADIVRGHLAAMEWGRPGERYILGGENLTHRRFLFMIAKVTHARPPLVVLPYHLVRWLAAPVALLPGGLPLPIEGHALRRAGYYFFYDNRKAQDQLGWVPRHTTEQAIADGFAWYHEQGIL